MSGTTAIVFGVCKDLPHLERTVEALRLGGFRNGDSSLLHPNRARSHTLARKHYSTEEVGVGAGAGIVLGGTLGFFASIWASFGHGPDLLATAGPVLTSLLGGGVCGILAGFAGALVRGPGIQNIESGRQEGMAIQQAIVLSVRADSPERVTKAKRILTECQLTDVFSANDPLGDSESGWGHRQWNSSGNR